MRRLECDVVYSAGTIEDNRSTLLLRLFRFFLFLQFAVFLELLDDLICRVLRDVTLNQRGDGARDELAAEPLWFNFMSITLNRSAHHSHRVGAPDQAAYCWFHWP